MSKENSIPLEMVSSQSWNMLGYISDSSMENKAGVEWAWGGDCSWAWSWVQNLTPCVQGPWCLEPIGTDWKLLLNEVLDSNWRVSLSLNCQSKETWAGLNGVGIGESSFGADSGGKVTNSVLEFEGREEKERMIFIRWTLVFPSLAQLGFDS